MITNHAAVISLGHIAELKTQEQINLTKSVKMFYNENNETLPNEIEEDTRRWKDLACLLAVRINIMKMAILLKAIY
jgi:hypothetical protein